MPKLNQHFTKLHNDYLFPQIQKKVALWKKSSPSLTPIHLGIGDISHPLPPSLTHALLEGAKEMGDPLAFKGYGPSEGYPFLREAIAQHEYGSLGIDPDEIFISNGAKCDIGNFQDLFESNNRVALPDPTYPVYLDTIVMAGQTKPRLKSGLYGGVTYLPCTEETQFQPLPPSSHVDLIYLCSPNNPTGVGIKRELLEKWIDYALRHGSLLFFDGAYETYIESSDVPHSIYEIPGAKKVAVEIRSFSKSAGFTNLRCSYAVIPKEIQIEDAGKVHSLHALWKRRHDTKFNGVPYPIQKAAAACFTSEGKQELQALITSYKERGKLLKNRLESKGATVYGGVDAPYLWWKVPSSMSSWDFFDLLLSKGGIVSTPGIGFGLRGEGFVRLSAFASKETLSEAAQRISSLL